MRRLEMDYSETTPTEITPAITAFCRRVSGHEPFFVSPQPATEAVELNCHLNVANHIKLYGGSVQNGWIIWHTEIEGESAYIEAEFHAVWRDPNGDLVDITPPKDGESKILFVPDHERKWEGVNISNQFQILTTNPALRQGIQASMMLQTGNVKGFDAAVSRTGIGRNDPCPCGSGKKFKKCCKV